MNKLPLLISIGLLALAGTALAGLHDRKLQQAEAAKTIIVKGATPITVSADYPSTFDSVIKAYQKADDPVVIADRDAGLVATEITITGGWRQTGTRTVVTFIKESDQETTVKVAVTTQKRYKAIQVEPWSDPVLDQALTKDAVAKLKVALGAK